MSRRDHRRAPLDPVPLVLTSDPAVREARTGYLVAVADRLHTAGYRVSPVVFARPDEPLAATCTVTAPTAHGDNQAGVVAAGWNEETGWSTRRDQTYESDQPGRSPGCLHLHLVLVPAPAIAAIFITTVLDPTVPTTSALGRAASRDPKQFRYHGGRAEILLRKLPLALHPRRLTSGAAQPVTAAHSSQRDPPHSDTASIDDRTPHSHDRHADLSRCGEVRRLVHDEVGLHAPADSMTSSLRNIGLVGKFQGREEFRRHILRLAATALSHLVGG